MAGLGVALLGFGVSTAAASANIVGPGGSGVAWTAPNVTSVGHKFTVTNPSTGGTMVLTCTEVLSGIHGAGDGVAYFAPRYSNCSFVISGNTCKTTVSVAGGEWSLTQGGGGPTTWVAATSTGTSTTTIAMDDVNGCGLVATDCTIKVAPQTGLSGFSASIVSGGVKLTGTIGGISWTSATSGCGMGPGASNGTYALPAAGVTIPGISLN